MDDFDKYQQTLSALKKDNAKMEQEVNKDPLAFIKKMGFDSDNLNIDELQKAAKSLSNQSNDFENIFQGKVFKQLRNVSNNIKDKSNLSDLEKTRLKDLGITAFSKDKENKEKSCFINNGCDKIIKAHSIQENGELSKLNGIVNGKQQVLQFIENPQTFSKDLKNIEITKASTFYGFCHKHDQIFEPIDKNSLSSNQQKYFLYSFRSFAFSYHNIKSHQDYTLTVVEDLSSGISPIIDSLNEVNSSLGLNLTDELNKANLPSINKEQKDILELVRFEKYRAFLIEYEKSKSYSQLEYLTYEVNHLCPIACSSWMVMHIDNFIVQQTKNTPYYGYPILISVLPNEQNKTTIVLARFKYDREIQLIFNQLNELKTDAKKFEMEISKLIFEKTENFYLQPDFWNYLGEEEKRVIVNGKNIEKTVFPEKRTEFEMINFFDKKYKLTE
jgi:hypothetical protein